jgi:mediator of replication checkpoint protein 1
MSSTEARRDTSPQPMHSLEAPRAANALAKLAESESDSEKDEALLRRTTGRLLSRLQQPTTEDSSEEEEGNSDEDAYERTKRRLAAARLTAVSSSDEEEDNGQGAYERMKQRLLTSTGLERRLVAEPTQDAQKPFAATAASSSEDEDDAPVRATRVRKLQTQRERTKSPAASLLPRPRSRQSSLGLFVTPEPSPARKPTRDAHTSDDASQRATPTRNADFRERVERIRAERLAKQAEEKQRRTKTTRRRGDEGPDSNSDGEGSRRLTQLAKPTRKAGKKALEAMARDQQRIVRNMQLSHQAKTKKRYGTKDLFAKFGFNHTVEDAESAGLPTPENSSVPATSDVEAAQARDTPPASPPSFEDAPDLDDTMTGLHGIQLVNLLHNHAPSAPAIVDKGKDCAPEFQHLPPNQMMQPSHPVTVQNVRVEPNSPAPEIMVDLDDSDDEPEVMKPKSRFPVFDNLPTTKVRESSSLLHLRHLAQLRSPGKKGSRGQRNMNMVQLQGSLFQKARQQAQKERQEKVEMLRAKGIVVETEEEREKRQMEVEDLVAQFEKEKEKDLNLAKRERQRAKKNGEIGDGLASSDEEEDEDYVASGDEDDATGLQDEADEAELEFSGSEDEEADDEQERDSDEGEEALEAEPANALIDTMAGESDEEAEQAEEVPHDRKDDDLLDAEPEANVRKASAKRVRKVIVDDDDDDDDEAPAELNGSPTQVATQDDTMAAFGFGDAAPAIGLTQAFAGTMANLESGSQTNQPLLQEPEQDSIDFLRSFPDSQPSLSQMNNFFIPNSQTAPSQQQYSQDGSVPPMNLGISQLLEETTIFSHTQASEVPEPTQDAGFLISRSPAGLVPPQSTTDTIMLPVAESPIAQRKGKLSRKRKEAPTVLSDVDDENIFSASEAEADIRRPTTEDAFSFLKKAAKEQNRIDTFNKKTSAAREHLDEQAYESDDEYKGLGGASDEDSGEEDADLADMIDTGDVKVDERKIAALFA